MRRYFVLTLICGSALYAQDLIPHPYAFAGGEGMGGGYAPFAMIGGGGFRIDSSRFLLDANGWYDNGHKVNNNDQPNPKGHDRGLVGSAYYRLSSGWAFGAGARWSELSTTNYKKSSWEPTFGGSKDFFHAGCRVETCARDFFSMRMGVDYMFERQQLAERLAGTSVHSLHSFAFGEGAHLLPRNRGYLQVLRHGDGPHECLSDTRANEQSPLGLIR